MTKNLKIVYVITERNGRNFWTRIGVAFVNSDGSLNVKLNSLPINGEMHIRDYVPPEERKPRNSSAPGPFGDGYDDDIPF